MEKIQLLKEAEARCTKGILGLQVFFEFALSLHDLVSGVTASAPGQALGLCLFCKMSSECLNPQMWDIIMIISPYLFPVWA